MKQWSVGRYLMKGDIVVRIEAEPEPGRYGIEYMQRYCGARATDPFSCGGHCWCVGGDELAPITDPVVILRCLLTDASRKKKAAEAVIEHEQRQIDWASFALSAIDVARQVADETAQVSRSTEEPSR